MSAAILVVLFLFVFLLLSGLPLWGCLLIVGGLAGLWWLVLEISKPRPRISRQEHYRRPSGRPRVRFRRRGTPLWSSEVKAPQGPYRTPGPDPIPEIVPEVNVVPVGLLTTDADTDFHHSGPQWNLHYRSEPVHHEPSGPTQHECQEASSDTGGDTSGSCGDAGCGSSGSID